MEFELCNGMGRSLGQAKAAQRSQSCRAKGLTPALCRDSGLRLAQQEQDTEQRSSSSLGCDLGRLGGCRDVGVQSPPSGSASMDCSGEMSNKGFNFVQSN